MECQLTQHCNSPAVVAPDMTQVTEKTVLGTECRMFQSWRKTTKQAGVFFMTWDLIELRRQCGSRGHGPQGLGQSWLEEVVMTTDVNGDQWLARWFPFWRCWAGACVITSSWKQHGYTQKYGYVVPCTRTALVSRTRRSECRQQSDENEDHNFQSTTRCHDIF